MDERDSTPTKTCTKCKEIKPIAEFTKDKQRSDGLRPSCKECKHVWSVAYYEATYEKQSAYAKAWAAANPEKKKANKKRHYDRHSAEVIAKAQAWRAANIDRARAYDAARYAADPAAERARSAAYKAANPEKGRQHVQNRRAKVRGNGGKLSKDISAKLFALQRGKCPCCARPLGDDYHLDHKMPLALGGTNTDDNMQLMRAQCNTSKRARHPIDYMQSKGFLL